jgi:hypothetical protein
VLSRAALPDFFESDETVSGTSAVSNAATRVTQTDISQAERPSGAIAAFHAACEDQTLVAALGNFVFARTIASSTVRTFSLVLDSATVPEKANYSRFNNF